MYFVVMKTYLIADVNEVGNKYLRYLGERPAYVCKTERSAHLKLKQFMKETEKGFRSMDEFDFMAAHKHFKDEELFDPKFTELFIDTVKISDEEDDYEYAEFITYRVDKCIGE